MVGSAQQRRALSRFKRGLMVMAVFYLTVGAALLHPLFHQAHHGTHAGVAYHHCESHHHAPCPLHDYCQNCNHVRATQPPGLAVPIFLSARYPVQVEAAAHHPRENQQPARAPPVV